MARAQEADSKLTTFKMVYAVEGSAYGGRRTTLTLVRRGEQYKIRNEHESGGFVAIYASGRDALGTYRCFATGNDQIGWRGSPPDQPPCSDNRLVGAEDDDEQLDEDATNQDVLNAIAGGFSISEFVNEGDSGVTVSGAPGRMIAGLKAECFEIRDDLGGEATICFAEHEGILLSARWKEDESEGLMELREFTERVADADITRPVLAAAPWP